MLKLEEKFDKYYKQLEKESLNESVEDAYFTNLMAHALELEDEGAIEEANYFKDDYPRLINYSETPNRFVLEFDADLDPNELEAYLAYTGKKFGQDEINSAVLIRPNVIKMDNLYD